MTIDSENVHYLMVPEELLKLNLTLPDLQAPVRLTYFFMIFQNLSKDLFQLKIESHLDILMNTLPPDIGLVVPFFDYYRGTPS